MNFYEKHAAEIMCLEDSGISNQTLEYALATQGESLSTLENVLYWKTGYQSFSQLESFGVYLAHS